MYIIVTSLAVFKRFGQCDLLIFVQHFIYLLLFYPSLMIYSCDGFILPPLNLS